jgi:signal transduction histidine kinase
VEDTGPGINKEDLGRIFDPGFTTKTRAGQGARGYGLWWTKVYVEGRLGGRIAVETEEGKGTVFSLTLSAAMCGPNCGERNR